MNTIKYLTPLGTLYPLITASDCKFLPFPMTTGYILKSFLALYYHTTGNRTLPKYWKTLHVAANSSPGDFLKQWKSIV